MRATQVESIGHPKNQVEFISVIQEPDTTKPRGPLNLLEITLRNFDGNYVESRMNVQSAMALMEQISRQVRDILKHYPVTDERRRKNNGK